MFAAISVSAVLMGLLHVAFCVVWLLKFLGVAIDGAVYTWGRIIVGLLCAIAIVAFLLSLIPGSGVSVPMVFRP
jgi:hypothetical protein